MYQGFPADLFNEAVRHLSECLSGHSCPPDRARVLIHAFFQLPTCGLHQWYSAFRVAAVRQVRIGTLRDLPQSICDGISM